MGLEPATFAARQVASTDEPRSSRGGTSDPLAALAPHARDAELLRTAPARWLKGRIGCEPRLFLWMAPAVINGETVFARVVGGCFLAMILAFLGGVGGGSWGTSSGSSRPTPMAMETSASTAPRSLVVCLAPSVFRSGF